MRLPAKDRDMRAAFAFTLPECLVSMAILGVLIGGVLGLFIYGLRMRQFTEPKLIASDEARKSLSLISSDIRSAFKIALGNGTLAKFAPVGPNAAQAGTAIQIYPGTNTNSFVRYYWDTADSRLKRTTNGTTCDLVVANSVTNQLVFQAEDFQGNVLSNNVNNRVISVVLTFYQPQATNKSGVRIGLYDYYQLRAKITRRTIL